MPLSAWDGARVKNPFLTREKRGSCQSSIRAFLVNAYIIKTTCKKLYSPTIQAPYS